VIILTEIQTERIGKWSNDASRFLKLHWNRIRDNPLTIYYIFVFSPRSSIFHQVYSKVESFPHPIVVVGLEDEWPSGTMAQTHRAWTHCLSPSEDILAAGGQREGSAVYSVWDIKTGDGKTFVHPCKTRDCRVCHVSFDHSRVYIELWTGCVCGKLCRWDISSDSHSLLEKMHLGSTGQYEWWSDEGNKVVCRIGDYGESKMDDDDEPVIKEGHSLYRLSILGTPLVLHSLFQVMGFTEWYFSPGYGDKIVGADREKIAVWKCSSGHQLFQRSHPFGEFPRIFFSPDGTMIVYVGDGATELISAEDGTVLRRWNMIKDMHSIKFFPEGDKFIGRDKEVVYLFSGDIINEKRIDCSAFFISPDGQRVATISCDGVDIFNHNLDEKLEHCHLSPYNPLDCHFSWIHSILVCIGNEMLSFHHLSHISRSSSATQQLLSVDRLLLSPDNRHLLALDRDSSIHVWDVKSGQRLHSPHNQITNFSGLVRMEYAPDSSCALVWDKSQLMVLQYSTDCIEWIPVVPPSSSELLAATFFQDSNRILIIETDDNVAIISLRDMSRHSMPRLHSQLYEIRQLVISPMEDQFAICSDSELIIRGTYQNIDRVHLLSHKVKSAVFSPEGTYLYILESMTYSGIMISGVDTQNGTILRILPQTINDSISRITLSIYNWRPFELDTMKADEFFALRVSYKGFRHYSDIFLSLSSHRQIIPPSSCLNGDQLEFRDQWLMTLPIEYTKTVVVNEDHLAYIDGGKALVLDYSSLIKQM
jgi:WD40 repeat protein